MTTIPANPITAPADDARVAPEICCADAGFSSVAVAAVPWLRFAVGLFVAAQTMLFGLAVNLTEEIDPATRTALQAAMLAAALLVLALLGGPLLTESLRAARRRQVTMELLFVAGVLGAFALSCQSLARGAGPVYFDVVAVLLIVYSIGRAVSTQSRRSALAAMRAVTGPLATARRVASPEASADEPVPVEAIRPGDLVRVLPGELVPIDGRIVQGQSLVTQTAFTGEWLPARRGVGDHVIAGAACQDGVLVVAATTPGGARRIDQLAALLAAAQARPSALQRQADRFVRWFLPAVLVTALGTFAYWTLARDLATGLFRVLAVLLVACPCAAGLAAPLVLWRALGRLARQGLVLRGGDALEALATADSVIFDKTGTLGDDDLELESWETAPGTDAAHDAATRAIVAAIERQSLHPVAAALRRLAVPEGAPAVTVQSVQLLPGRGVKAVVGVAARAGCHGLTASSRQTVPSPRPQVQTRSAGADAGQTVAPFVARLLRDDARAAAGRLRIRVEVAGGWAATAVVREALRPGAAEAVADLRRLGLAVRVMTGDSAAGAAGVAHLAATAARLSPEAKHAAVLALRDGAPHFRRPLFVGDGLNDAAAMAAAHCSIALASGSAVAVHTAAGTLHGGDLRRIARAIALARRALAVARVNLLWAAAYNLVGILAAVTGCLHPVLAALLMAGSSALVAWRSFRAGDRLSDDVDDAAPARGSGAGTQGSGFGVQGSGSERPRHLVAAFAALHVLAMLGQAAILCRLADLSLVPSSVVALGFVVVTLALLRRWPRFPAWADMTWSMVTLGGLGMVLGWWADQGFAAIAGAAGPACCGPGPTGGAAAGMLSGMNLGMLALGVPAMFLVRYRSQRFDWRRWCCTGMIALGVPAMIAGMTAGSWLAAAWGRGWSLAGRVGVDYGLMMAGMVAGMLLPHALEYALPRRRGADPMTITSTSRSGAVSAALTPRPAATAASASPVDTPVDTPPASRRPSPP